MALITNKLKYKVQIQNWKQMHNFVIHCCITKLLMFKTKIKNCFKFNIYRADCKPINFSTPYHASLQ